MRMPLRFPFYPRPVEDETGERQELIAVDKTAQYRPPSAPSSRMPRPLIPAIGTRNRLKHSAVLRTIGFGTLILVMLGCSMLMDSLVDGVVELQRHTTLRLLAWWLSDLGTGSFIALASLVIALVLLLMRHLPAARQVSLYCRYRFGRGSHGEPGPGSHRANPSARRRGPGCLWNLIPWRLYHWSVPVQLLPIGSRRDRVGVGSCRLGH